VLLTLILVAISVAATYAATRFVLSSRSRSNGESAAAKWQKEAELRTRELQESLAQQAVTSEILHVISGSPSDLQPVLAAVAERAARLTAGGDCQLYLVDGGYVKRIARYGPLAVDPASDRLPIRRDFVTGKAILDRCVVHVTDLLAQDDQEFAASRAIATRTGIRTVLIVPMIRASVCIGVIAIRRMEVAPFTDRQIELLKTFADQAVIAIENVRLFQELQTRTQELARSVEQLRSLAQVGQAVNSTLELEQVLSTIVSRAVQLSAADQGIVYELDADSEKLLPRASHGVSCDLMQEVTARPLTLSESIVGRAAVAGVPIQVPDINTDTSYTGRIRDAAERAGFRALLGVPLTREGHVVGGLAIGRNTPSAFADEVVEVCRRSQLSQPWRCKTHVCFARSSRRAASWKLQASTSRSFSPT